MVEMVDLGSFLTDFQPIMRTKSFMYIILPMWNYPTAV